jgi:tetratricopeptide (TPR) repeat protein
MKRVFVLMLFVSLLGWNKGAWADPLASKAQAYSAVVKAQLLRMERADPSKILPLYQRILEALPVPQAYVDTTHIFLEKGDLNSAVEVLEKGANRFPHSFTLHFLLGELYGSMGKRNLALLHLNRALELSPKDEQVYQRLIGFYMEKSNYDAANALLEKWQKVAPHSCSLYLTWAKVYMAMGLYSQALEKLQRAQGENPQNPEVLEYMGQLYQLKGEPEKAIDAYKRLLRISPGSIKVLDRLGRLYIKEERYPLALKLYGSLLQQRPGHPQLVAKVVSILMAMGNREKALRTLDDALKINKNEHLFFMKGILLEDMDRKEEALKVFQGVIGDGKPHEPSFYIQVAGICAEKGEKEKALEVLRKGIALKPDAAELYRAMATLYSGMGKKDKALVNAAYAVVLKPRDPFYLFSLGALLEREGKWKKGEKFLKRALELDPQNPVILNYLGYMYIDRGVKLEEGIQLVKKALKVKPDSPYYLDSLAWGLFKRGQVKEALEIQKKALRLIKREKRNNAIMLGHLGAMYMALGMREKAKATYTKALKYINNKELTSWEREEIIRSAKALGLSLP